MLQELRTLVEAAIARVQTTKVGALEIVDGGDGTAYAGIVASYPAAVAKVLQETGSAIGLDIEKLIGAGAHRKNEGGR